MPSNRTKTMRSRIGGGDITSWIRWHTTILRVIPKHIGTGLESPWTSETAQSFWKKYKKSIMAVYLEQMREKGRPFQRPSEYWVELETQFPRLKVGSETWVGPLRADGGDRTMVCDIHESDEVYLSRLGLLADWEMEVKNADKSTKKNKNK